MSKGASNPVDTASIEAAEELAAPLDGEKRPACVADVIVLYR